MDAAQAKAQRQGKGRKMFVFDNQITIEDRAFLESYPESVTISL
jgi:hypothetical protein